MQLESRDLDTTRLITAGGDRLDAAAAIRFKDEMRNLTHDGPARIVLDMSAVSFMDSSGLGAVVGAMKQLNPDQVLELAGLTPTVMRVFSLTRMDTVFTIHPDVQTALGDDYAHAS